MIIDLTDHIQKQNSTFSNPTKIAQLFWNKSSNAITLRLNRETIGLLPNQIIITSTFHSIHFDKDNLPLIHIVYYPELSHIAKYDIKWLHCNLELLFNNRPITIISIPHKELLVFNAIYQIIENEFNANSNIKKEVILIMIKKLLTMLIDIANNQNEYVSLNNQTPDTIKEFKYLVALNYKTKKRVDDYAKMLYKSPKTISNIFLKYRQQSPLQIIHEHIILETKRLVSFSNKSIKEIAFDLGYENPSSLSRLFKNHNGCSILEYKNSIL